MRRPQGFDQPAAPAPEPAATPAKPATRGARRSARGNAPSAPVRSTGKGGEGNASDNTSTEPITLPAAAPASSAAPIAPVWPLRRPGTSTTESETASAPTLKESTGALHAPTPPVPTPPAPTTPLTPAGARRKFRSARRARKLYEREEVRRFTWRSRRRRTIWLASIGVVATLAAFVLVGAYSPLMALKTIEVVGTNRVPADQVQAALGEQLGTPLPLVDFSLIKKELSQFTLIRSYVTESRPPDTLVVRIIEREPIGAVVSSAGFDLVDAAGVVIQSGAERPAGYAVIEARAGAGSPGFGAAAAVVTALPESIRSQLDTVTAATADDVTLTLVGGARVVWGSAEKSDYKAVVLAALVVSHPVGSVGEYDVSSPDSAVLR